MTARVTALAGPARSGKTERMLRLYRRALAGAAAGATLWLAPTWRAAAAIRDRLLDGALEACFSPAVMTFDRFAEAVLESSARPIRPLGRLIERQLVRRLIDELTARGRIRHFRPIVRSAGLVDGVCQFIQELKRLDIWPDRLRAACGKRGMSQKGAELLEIYDAYQQALAQHSFYDAEGRFWSARELLREGSRRPFERLQLVVVDGFADFTPPQHEIFQILAGWVAELWIALPLEDGSERRDLFHKPLATLAELRRRHPGLTVEPIGRPKKPAWPAMAHLEANLFLNPRLLKPATDTAGLEILATCRQLGEIERIGSRIKQLLCEGDPEQDGASVRPGEIAVVFRSLRDVEDLVREVFGRLGIPLALESRQPLGRSKALAALVRLIRLDTEDWPFRDLLAVLSSNYFQPEWPEWQDGKAAWSAERWIRRLQIPRGRERLLDEIERLVDRLAAGNASEDAHADQRAQQAQAALRLLGRLNQAFQALPERATLAQWRRAWTSLAAETGLLRAIEQDAAGSDSPSNPADKAAWDRFQWALGVDQQMGRWLDRASPPLNRREALAGLLDLLGSVAIPGRQHESGCVRVLSAPSARALEIPYLFVAGLAEKAFPLAEREDRLYSEAEYSGLIDTGLPLAAHGERSREEMLLFYEVITRATRRLYLSYPAFDEAAQSLSPSPYLEEVELACGPGKIERTEAADLSPIPEGEQPMAAAEFRVKAVSEALDGNIALLAGLLSHEPGTGLADNILAGLRITRQRQDRGGFGPAEGMIQGPKVRQRLGRMFGPDKTFSATELEQFALCPFRFFAERVIGLEPLEDLTLAVDYLARGRLVHEALAALHRRMNQTAGCPTSPADLSTEQYGRLLDETLEGALGGRGGGPMETVLAEVDRRLFARWAADYRQQHERYDRLWEGCEAPLRPTWFEVSFGRSGGKPPSTDRVLELSGAGRPIRIAGRIDRIDIGTAAGRTVFNVLDYKTSASARFRPDDVQKGVALQLPLYAMAAERLLLADQQAVGLQAGYWLIRDKGFSADHALKMNDCRKNRLEPDEHWESLRRATTETVAALIRSITGGEFPVSSAHDDCTRYCPFSTICRINQVRSLGKTWQPWPPKS